MLGGLLTYLDVGRQPLVCQSYFTLCVRTFHGASVREFSKCDCGWLHAYGAKCAYAPNGRMNMRQIAAPCMLCIAWQGYMLMSTQF
jgi:hypothetical protein